MTNTGLPQPRIVSDLDGALWVVTEARPTKHGFDLLLGRPQNYSGRGGATVIMTPELAACLHRHRYPVRGVDLPVGNTVIKRLRRSLLPDAATDHYNWWRERLMDLSEMTAPEFAATHGVSAHVAATTRLRLLGKVTRKTGWWRDPAIVDEIMAAPTRAEVASSYNVPVSVIGKVRTLVRRDRGEPMDKAAVSRRISASKVSLEAPPNTRKALVEAASRPKSPEWRAALSERNRARPRPESWIKREWTPEQDALLGTMPDRDVAHHLNRTLAGVRGRRRSLGIPACKP